MEQQYEHEPAPGSPISDDEGGLRGESGFAALVSNIVAEQKASWQDEIKREIEQMRKPVTPDVLNRDGETVVKTRSPYERLYRKMSDEEREWRNPDSDHWMAEWLRGQAYRDHGRKLNALHKLEGMFGRAVMTEGVAGASGAVSTGTGGELIPRPLEAVVLIARDRVAKMRRFARQITMTAQTHTIPTAAAMTSSMVGESTTAADGNPAIAQVQLTAQKGQVTALATNEMMSDAAINLINLWATRGGASLGVLEDNQFFADGNGTPPNISAFLSGTAYAETTSGILAFVDAATMYYALGQQYRQRAVWMVSANVLQLLTLLRNTTTGTQFYLGLTDKPGPISDDPTAEGTIFRRPVYEVPFANGTVWFGVPEDTYVIGQRAGLESRVSDQVKFDLDQVMWKLTQRFDGINVDTAAAQVATGITSVSDAIA